MTKPGRTSRAAAFSTCEPVLPLVEELSSAPDVWEAFERLAALPHVLFLDSALQHPRLGRYSFLTADPFDWICVEALFAFRETQPVADDPFTILAQRLAQYQAPSVPGLPPFQGGAAGLFGYDLCHHLERLPWPRFDEFAVPDLAVGFYDWVLAYDHLAERTWLISTGFPLQDPPRRRRRAEHRLEEVKRRLAVPPPAPRAFPASPRRRVVMSHPVPGHAGLLSSFDRPGYLDTARRAVEYVRAGDCFQVNLAQRLLAPLEEPPQEIYRRLRARNAATFAGFFDLGEFMIASASPERFLRVEQGRIETRPIKGTRPRGATPAEDETRRQDLLQSVKDRAENIMIVDLLRNDLGRVCRYGSIEVAAVCRLETYRFVHHLVSEVRGQLREGLGPIDLLRATFPGGSVTGAPKIRAMEIIAELEPTARGPYCGCLGYLGFDGSMDTNILIRTMTAGGGWVQFPVGGGIVADSTAELEYEETWHKAEGLLRALRE